MKTTLNSFFQTVFCITLELNKDNPDHPERLRNMIYEFQKHGISVEFINGIDGRLLDMDEPPSIDGDSVVRKADMGCTLSHLKVARIAKERCLMNYFVFEDDARLCEQFQYKFGHFIGQLPLSYNMIYLGGDNQEKCPPEGDETERDNIKGTKRTLTTHAYGVSAKAYDAVIAALSKHEKVDLNMTEVHRQGGCYIMDPVLVGQRPGWSYILNKEVQNEHKFFQV